MLDGKMFSLNQAILELSEAQQRETAGEDMMDEDDLT